MSHGSQISRKRAQIADLQLEFGAITGLPISPCPRCGDKVLELRSWKHGGQPFFKCRQNDQDVPYQYRKCGFYKSAEEYARLAASWTDQHGINNGGHEFVAQSMNKVPEDPQCNYREDGKMEKLVKLAEWLLFTNVVIAIVVSLVVVIMIVK